MKKKLLIGILGMGLLLSGPIARAEDGIVAQFTAWFEGLSDTSEALQAKRQEAEEALRRLQDERAKAEDALKRLKVEIGEATANWEEERRRRQKELDGLNAERENAKAETGDLIKALREEQKNWQETRKQLAKELEQLKCAQEEAARRLAQRQEATNWRKRLEAIPNLKKFLDANALDRIDALRYFNDIDYGTIADTPYGDLVICRADIDLKYGFLDRETLRNKLLNQFTGRPAIRGDRVFLLSLAENADAWEKNIASLGESLFCSLKSLNPRRARDKELADFELINVLRRKNPADILRLFFETSYDGLYVAVFVRVDGASSVYVAAPKSSFKVVGKEALMAEFQAPARVRLDRDVNDVAFYLQRPDDRLEASDAKGCLDIFLSQLEEALAVK